MSNTEINRQIVQRGLDRRAAEAKRKEAVLEGQARKLRLIINDNHIRAQKGYAAQELANAKSAALARRQEERAERAKEAAWCADWYRFLFRIFCPFFVATLAMFLSYCNVIHVFLAVSVAIVFALIGFKNFADRYLTINTIQ